MTQPKFLAFSPCQSLKVATPSKSPVLATKFLHHAQALGKHIPETPLPSEQGPSLVIFLHYRESSEQSLLCLNLVCLLGKFHL